MKYRRDIDGLRAVAVMLVVIYHARFLVNDAVILKGGFIGVDVFFVISGYLITSVIAKELEQNRFSIGKFYERRIRRIMPALLFLLVAAVPTAFFVLSPGALNEFSGSVPATLLFYANAFFYAQDGYAAEPSQLKPLLHMWSIAVEEQFYLVFPPFMMLLWRAGWRIRRAALALPFVISLAVAQYLAPRYSDANFFLLPSRGWELLAGSGLALYGARLRTVVGTAGRWLPTTGLVAICLSAVRFDDNTLHPSVWTLIPVLGAVAIVGFPDSRSWTTQILSSTWFVRVGLISYSLYLWHFMIFAFGRVIADGDVGLGRRIEWILLSFAMATISLKYVEQPFRQPGRIATAEVLSGVGAIAFVLGGVTVVQATRDVQEAFPNIPREIDSTFDTWVDQYTGLPTCVDQERYLDPTTWCGLGLEGGQPDFLLVGDSHAYAQAAVFDAGARAVGLRGLLVARSGCPLLLELEPARGEPLSQDCLKLAAAVVEFADEHAVDRVILASRWNYYICGDPVPNCGFTQVTRFRDQPFGGPTETRLSYLTQALSETVSAYAATGASVGLLAQVPHQPDDPRVIFDKAFSAEDTSLIARSSVASASHLRFTDDARQMLVDIAESYPQTMVLDQSTVLCSADRCPVGTASGSFYADSNHLSNAAAEALTDWTVLALSR